MIGSFINVGIENLQVPTGEKTPAELAEEIEQLELAERIRANQEKGMNEEKIVNPVNTENESS